MHSSEKHYIYFTLMSRMVVFKCDPKKQHFNCLRQVLRRTLSTTFLKIIFRKLSQVRPGPKGQVIRTGKHFRSTYDATLLHCKLKELFPGCSTCHAINFSVASCSNMLRKVDPSSSFCNNFFKLATLNFVAWKVEHTVVIRAATLFNLQCNNPRGGTQVYK